MPDKLKIRKPYDPHERVKKLFGDPSRAKQSMAAECDINNILAAYKRTGLITHLNENKAIYADLPEPLDYQESMNAAIVVADVFSSLPSEMRNRFHNDPAEFLEFLHATDNIEEKRQLGLADTPSDVPAEGKPEPAPAPPSPPAEGP